jgi:cytochrome b6-f complex iron-sulfur subunit
MTEMTSENAQVLPRRNVVAKLFTWLGGCSLFASLLSTLYANFRFFYPKALYEPPLTFKAGKPADYPLGTVTDRWVKDHGVWIVRSQSGIYALTATCTHLGCMTRYYADESLFKCPCHGSNFTVQGDPIAGPAPYPLFRLALRRAEDGEIVVDKANQENRPSLRLRPPYILEV